MSTDGGWECDFYNTGSPTRVCNARARCGEPQPSTARAEVPAVQEFGTVDELLAALDSIVAVGDPVASGGEEGTAALTNTVAAYRRANGTYVASYVRYNAGVADVGNSYMRAGTLDVVTRRVGGTFLVLDAGVTAISSYREAEGHSERYRLTYSAVKTGGTLAGGASGVWAGGKIGAAGGSVVGPIGAGIGAVVLGTAGAVVGSWAGGRVADEVWDFSYERIS